MQLERLLCLFANTGIYTATSTSTSTSHYIPPEEPLSMEILKEVRAWLVSLQPSRGGGGSSSSGRGAGKGTGKWKGIRGQPQEQVQEQGSANTDTLGRTEIEIEMGRYVAYTF